MSSFKTIGQSVNEIAEAAIKEGQKIEINYRMPTVSIESPGYNDWFFQGEEANNLIEEARKSRLHNYCSVENIILWQSQGW